MPQSFHASGATNQPIQNVLWARVVREPVGVATWQRDEESEIQIVSLTSLRAREFVQSGMIHRRPFRLTIVGVLDIEYSTDLYDPFPGEATPYRAGGGTDVSEIDSGPIAIAAAEVRPLIGPNPNRRGVTIQNVGLTAIAISKTGVGTALATVGQILSPGAAVNDGTGGSVSFDGWTGSVFGANVAGGPGSVLVSAY